MIEHSAHPFHADRRIQADPASRLPHSACPVCWLDATTDAPGQMLTFRCTRGHEWLQTRPAALKHAGWLATLRLGPEQVRQT